MSSVTQQRNVSVEKYLDIDYRDACSECDEMPCMTECNRCGNGVCNSISCQWEFPHRYNTNYIICNDCYKRIDSKLINYDHLLVYKFLKNKTIKRRASY
jgi:hypothetical protein